MEVSYADLESRIEDLEDRIQELIEENQDVADDLNKSDEELAEAKKEAASNQQNYEEEYNLSEELKETCVKYEDEIADLKDTVQALEKELSNYD